VGGHIAPFSEPLYFTDTIRPMLYDESVVCNGSVSLSVCAHISPSLSICMPVLPLSLSVWLFVCLCLSFYGYLSHTPEVAYKLARL